MYDISGSWSYKLDSDDTGSKNHWYQGFNEDGEFTFPGSNTDNNIGSSYVYDGKLSKENVHMLRSRYSYIGKIWFKKRIKLDGFDERKVYKIIFERIMWQSSLWINGNFIGTCDSLSTSHVFDITEFTAPSMEITLCIDNRDIHEIGTAPSAYTEETQTIWNGAIGKMHIVESVLKEEKINVFADFDGESIVLNADLEFMDTSEQYKLNINIYDETKLIDSAVYSLKKKDVLNEKFKLNSINYWDENNPHLYKVKISIENHAGTNVLNFSKSIGFRKFTNNRGQMLLNNNPVFLRGTVDCCIFPKTGYPPMDIDSWKKILTKIKSYGFNHVRYHSWCPPEAAFDAADQLGLYLQVEGPIWLDDYMPFVLGDKPDHYTFFERESAQIVDEYGDHPSFCFFSCGNELRGDNTILRNIVKKLKTMNKSILYTCTSNWDRSVYPEEDFFIAQTVEKKPVRGQYYLDELSNGTNVNFNDAIKQRDITIISHEVGQYSIYPRIQEISKYNGNLLPVNFEAIKDDLIKKNMVEEAEVFTHDSGRLAFELYKSEVEAALGTDRMGGFQLLGLNDFTGQSTATVGMLDSFWEDKNITNADEFKQFNNTIVPLAIFKKRNFYSNELFSFLPKVANYLKDIKKVDFYWSLKNREGKVLIEKNCNIKNISMGLNNVKEIQSFTVGDKISKSEQLVLEMKIRFDDETYENSWNLWCYKLLDKKYNKYFIQSNYIDDEIMRRVYNGENLLLEPKSRFIKNAEKTTFFSVFWSPVHFMSKDSCGAHIDLNCPLFELFPTDSYTNFQWKDLLTGAFSIKYPDTIENFQPLVQVIPNFFNNRKNFVLAEFKFGKGNILINTLNMTKDTPAVKAFKKSVNCYLQSDEFHPLSEIDKKQLEIFFYKDGETPEKNNLALGCKSFADSQKGSDYDPNNAIDKNLDKVWKASDNDGGHWLKINLGEEKYLTSLEIDTLSKGVYYYNVDISSDDVVYHKVVNSTVSTQDDLTVTASLNDNARYVKITFTDCNEGATVGVRSIRIY